MDDLPPIVRVSIFVCATGVAGSTDYAAPLRYRMIHSPIW